MKDIKKVVFSGNLLANVQPSKTKQYRKIHNLITLNN